MPRTVQALLVGALAALPAGSQPQVSDLIEAVDVRLVNIEVVVTGKGGQRVTGLPAGDFVLTVDEQPTAVEFFSEVRAEAAAEDPSSEGRGTDFLLFVDDAMTLARDRNRVLDRVLQQAVVAGPNDRIAVIAYDGGDLTVLMSWTNDPEVLERAIEAAKSRPAFEANRKRSQVDKDHADFAGGDGDTDPLPVIRVGALFPLESTVESIGAFLRQGVTAGVLAMRALSEPHGTSPTGASSRRRVMLMLLGQWPDAPLSTRENVRGRHFERSQSFSELAELEPGRVLSPLIETASYLGFSIYPIDVQGQSRRVGVDATLSPVGFDGQQQVVRQSDGGFEREATVRGAFELLARETGGLSLQNAQRDKAFATVFEDTRQYYWLGFTPTMGNDSSHRVAVAVRDRPELEVRTRSGFVGATREAGLDEDTPNLTTLSPDDGDSSQERELTVRVIGSPQKAGARKITVRIEVGIPLASVTLLEREGRYSNTLEIRLLLSDNEGRRSRVVTDTIPIDAGAAPRPGQLLWYETSITMRRRDHRFVATVYDPLDGSTLTGATEIKVD